MNFDIVRGKSQHVFKFIGERKREKGGVEMMRRMEIERNVNEVEIKMMVVDPSRSTEKSQSKGKE